MPGIEPSTVDRRAGTWRAMPEISFTESSRQIRAITDRVQRSEKANDWDGAAEALQELLGHPCAHHQVLAHEVWDDIHELRKRAGDYDGAISAKREAVAAGYRSVPDPDADIAECQLLAGRRAEADALFADLRARTPDDVWLYNSAGFAYAEISDDAESARWFREGIDVAMRRRRPPPGPTSSRTSRPTTPPTASGSRAASSAWPAP